MRNFFIKRRFDYDMELRTATEKKLNSNFNQMEFDQKSAEVLYLNNNQRSYKK